MRWRPWWHTLTALQRVAVLGGLAGILWVIADTITAVHP